MATTFPRIYIQSVRVKNSAYKRFLADLAPWAANENARHSNPRAESESVI